MNELTEGIGSLSDLVKQDPPNPSDVEIEYKQETRNITRSLQKLTVFVLGIILLGP